MASLWQRLVVLLACLTLFACGTAPQKRYTGDLEPTAQGREVVIYALGLADTGYRFGGKNPDAGLDCSGMVSYVYRKAASFNLTGSAADMSRRGRRVDINHLRLGDLVFFNTTGRSHSHVGIYIGGGRFVHAPSSGGKVRIDSLFKGWFAKRFEEVRTYFD